MEKRLFSAAILLCLSVSSYVAAETASITYANILVQANPPSFATEAEKLLGGPILDAGGGVIFQSTTEATYGDFDSRIEYDADLLTSLLGAGAESADFVAIDANGINSGGGQFEDSVWIFSDGVNTIVHIHDYDDEPNGPVVGNNERLNVGLLYNSLFGASWDPDHDFGVLLFNLASVGIDTSSPEFEVTLTGGSVVGAPSSGTAIPDVVLLGKISTAIHIDIDIKPGNKRNVINPREKGGIWVVILSDTDSESPFDPSSQVDIPTVEFGPDGAKAIRHKVGDINGDGLGDLLLRFKVPETGIACGDTEATLIGETFEGQKFAGTDSIKTIGCEAKVCENTKHHEKHHDGKRHDKKYEKVRHDNERNDENSKEDKRK